MNENLKMIDRSVSASLIFSFIKAKKFFPHYAPGVKNWTHKMRGKNGRNNFIGFTKEDCVEINKGLTKLNHSFRALKLLSIAIFLLLASCSTTRTATLQYLTVIHTDGISVQFKEVPGMYYILDSVIVGQHLPAGLLKMMDPNFAHTPETIEEVFLKINK